VVSLMEWQVSSYATMIECGSLSSVSPQIHLLIFNLCFFFIFHLPPSTQWHEKALESKRVSARAIVNMQIAGQLVSYTTASLRMWICRVEAFVHHRIGGVCSKLHS
jgi:hypothetical protein